MQTYPMKRIEIIIEAPLERRMIEQLDHAGVTGYSVLPVIGGRGLDGVWSAEGQIGDANRMVSIVSITDQAKADKVLRDVFSLLKHQIGIVSMSDVTVVRPEHF